MDFHILCVLWALGAAAATVPLGRKRFPRLRGVNRSGPEYSCMKSPRVFDGPSDDETVRKMAEWKINVVRVPMNEGCWLKKDVPHDESSGDNYKREMKQWIDRLRSHGLYVILELHWTEGLYSINTGENVCSEQGAKCQKPMPNADSSVKFWKEVATMFKDDEGIIFDLFNEPFPERSISDKDQAWKCWKSGHGECTSGFQYEVAGMQDLIDAVRETGAKNVILLGGLDYSNDLSEWLEYVPADSENNIAASMHIYNDNRCKTRECWEAGIGKISEKYPVIVGEIGQKDCKHDFIDGLMDYLEGKEISYLAWTWNNWDCNTGPSLIKDDNGTPTDFGIGFKDYLAKVPS